MLWVWNLFFCVALTQLIVSHTPAFPATPEAAPLVVGAPGLGQQLLLLAVLVLPFMMLWTGKWHRRSGVITGAEWMLFRFGRDRWGHFARLMSLVSQVVINLALLAYSFKGAGLFLSMFLPFSPLVCSMIAPNRT